MNVTAPASCPACDAGAVDAIDGWAVAAGHKAMACRACGLLFTNPPPSPEALQRYYGRDGDWQTSHAEKRAKAQTKTKRAAPALLAVLDRHFPRRVHARALLFSTSVAEPARGSTLFRITGGKHTGWNHRPMSHSGGTNGSTACRPPRASTS